MGESREPDRYEGPAARLEGRELPNGWTVGERLDRLPEAEGELYSVGYLVGNRDGRTAYLKAHDYARAINENVAEFSRVLADMLDAHNFERDLNDHCTQVRMSRTMAVRLRWDTRILPAIRPTRPRSAFTDSSCPMSRPDSRPEISTCSAASSSICSAVVARPARC